MNGFPPRCEPSCRQFGQEIWKHLLLFLLPSPPPSYPDCDGYNNGKTKGVISGYCHCWFWIGAESFSLLLLYLICLLIQDCPSGKAFRWSLMAMCETHRNKSSSLLQATAFSWAFTWQSQSWQHWFAHIHCSDWIWWVHTSSLKKKPSTQAL